MSDEKLWDESPTSRHLQVLYHQTSFQNIWSSMRAPWASEGVLGGTASRYNFLGKDPYEMFCPFWKKHGSKLLGLTLWGTFRIKTLRSPCCPMLVTGLLITKWIYDKIAFHCWQSIAPILLNRNNGFFFHMTQPTSRSTVKSCTTVWKQLYKSRVVRIIYVRVTKMLPPQDPRMSPAGLS